MKFKTKQTSKNISEIERIKLDLLSLVSHELRTPLSLVLNSIKQLKEGTLSVSEKDMFWDMALRNAETLNLKLNQLLDLSKLVSGRLVCRFQELSFKQVLLHNLEWLEIEAAKHNLKINVHANLAELPILLGDAPRLDKVIYSVFENAVKFAKPGSTIQVDLKVGKAVVLEIQNVMAHPLSVETENLIKVFSQQESILNRKYEGVGGSLALSSEVLLQHGGRLDIQVKKEDFNVRIEIPVLENEEALFKLIESRIFALHTEVGAMSLMLLKLDRRQAKVVCESIKSVLFRASDFVYPLEESGQNYCAVVLDDCKKEDAPKLVDRLLSKLDHETMKLLKGGHPEIGFATCPDDTTDPEKLVELAKKRLHPL